MLSTRARLGSRQAGTRTRIAAVGVVLVIVALAIVAGAAMTRQNPEAPDLPLIQGMTQVASGSMDVTMRGLDHKDATSTVFTAQSSVADVYRFYTWDVTEQGWTLISGVEDAEGSAVVYLVRYDSVVMVQVMDVDLAIARRITDNPDINLDLDDIVGSETVIIVGRFECTDESGTAVCLDYIIQGR